MAEPPLARLLLLASRWFDACTLDELARRGWPRLSPAQSLLFAFLERDGVPPAELARRLGHTRQAVQDLVDGLVRMDLLEMRSNPARRGGRLVCLTDAGSSLAGEAYDILTELELRIGTRRAKTLRRCLGEFEWTR
ncbi:MarR family winged helix-turn-helix transcriptional regulator [Geodermatophilus sp. FMUSA9-8]|uniref:MarR family winged helix-turn-helix transcriptional regulator n=1 Tax=Geodermatophilus sp. FMUSA9-8 TaxID=3120155 RepID=UPI00300BC391